MSRILYILALAFAGMAGCDAPVVEAPVAIGPPLIVVNIPPTSMPTIPPWPAIPPGAVVVNLTVNVQLGAKDGPFWQFSPTLTVKPSLLGATRPAEAP